MPLKPPPGGSYSLEESDGKRDWPTIFGMGIASVFVVAVVLALIWPWLP